MLRQDADFVNPTTNHLCSSRYIFRNYICLPGAPVPNRGAPEMGDVPEGTIYIWNYPSSIMFRWYVSHRQSNYHCRAPNRVERGAFAGHLLIGMIRSWSCPVHASDVHIFKFLFTGYMIESVASCVSTEIDAIDSIVLSACDACCRIQLLCHMLSLPHYPLQLPAYEPSSLLDQGYKSDQAPGSR